MKTIKDTILLLLILFISNSILAQKEGCISGDCQNGQGTFVIHNNLLDYTQSKYIGNWENGVKKGEGTFIEYDYAGKEERKMVGNWTWDENTHKPSGTGKDYRYGELVYEGDIKNGIPNKTLGCIAGDCNNGYGVFMDPKKNRYIGEHKNGKKDGFGVFLTPKRGMYYATNWSNDKIAENKIKIFNFDNELLGILNVKEGKPMASLSDNKVDVGCVKGDCENGFGHYLWEDGTKYIGEYKNGTQHGQGAFTWAEGKYIGEFNEGKSNGYGKEYDKEKKLIRQGTWSNGTFLENLSIEKTYSKDEKCTLGNCIDGFGIYVKTFEPGWKDAYRDYVNEYEIKYEGFWKEGEYHGIGYGEDRMAQQYVGLFKDGEIDDGD